MSLSGKIKKVVGASQEVEIRVPPIDPAVAVVEGIDAWRDGATQLLKERNEHKERAEYLWQQNGAMRLTIERMERDHKSSIYDVKTDLEYWRKLSLELLHANADLKNTINGMKNFIGMADNTLRHTEQLQKQLKVEEPLELEKQFDEKGVPVNGNGAKAVSAEELQHLIGSLEKAQPNA